MDFKTAAAAERKGRKKAHGKGNFAPWQQEGKSAANNKRPSRLGERSKTASRPFAHIKVAQAMRAANAIIKILFK